MKTAVSIPDEIFEKVERLAEREGRSRNEVYAAALRKYVARHVPDEITDAMNRVCDRVGTGPVEFRPPPRAASSRSSSGDRGAVPWARSSYTDSDVHGSSRSVSPWYCIR